MRILNFIKQLCIRLIGAHFLISILAATFSTQLIMKLFYIFRTEVLLGVDNQKCTAGCFNDVHLVSLSNVLLALFTFLCDCLRCSSGGESLPVKLPSVYKNVQDQGRGEDLWASGQNEIWAPGKMSCERYAEGALI